MTVVEQGSIEKVIHLFELRIGLCPNVFTTQSWTRFLKERMKSTQITDSEVYYQLLVQSESEFLALLELVIVPESWFFRESKALEYVVDSVEHAAQERRHIRILDAACSTGEEPYSLAILAELRNLPAKAYSIDAIDISTRSINEALEGFYRPHSFRGNDESLRDRFFKKSERGFVLDPAIKKQVHFYAGNLADAAFMQAFKEYDFIFCRNLFIYQTEPFLKTILRIFESKLTPRGVLFVGATEAEPVRKLGWVQIKPIDLCGFHSPIPVEVPPVPIRAAPQKMVMKKTELPQKTEGISTPLARASQLANQGEHEDALALCLSYIKKEGKVDPQAYFLMGVIEHACEKVDIAEDYFAKALYLQPNHQEALAYLALLAEKKGDYQRATLYRNRLHRLENANE